MRQKTQTTTTQAAKSGRGKSEAFDKAAVFAALFAKYDYRANGQYRSQYLYWELSMGL